MLRSDEFYMHRAMDQAHLAFTAGEVPVGAVVSCYTRMQDIGRSSMQILVEVWIREDTGTLSKVTEGHFTFVAIDDTGRTRAVPRD